MQYYSRCTWFFPSKWHTATGSADQPWSYPRCGEGIECFRIRPWGIWKYNLCSWSTVRFHIFLCTSQQTWKINIHKLLNANLEISYLFDIDVFHLQVDLLQSPFVHGLVPTWTYLIHSWNEFWISSNESYGAWQIKFRTKKNLVTFGHTRFPNTRLGSDSGWTPSVGSFGSRCSTSTF